MLIESTNPKVSLKSRRIEKRFSKPVKSLLFESTDSETYLFKLLIELKNSEKQFLMIKKCFWSHVWWKIFERSRLKSNIAVFSLDRCLNRCRLCAQNSLKSLDKMSDESNFVCSNQFCNLPSQFVYGAIQHYSNDIRTIMTWLL